MYFFDSLVAFSRHPAMYDDNYIRADVKIEFDDGEYRIVIVEGMVVHGPMDLTVE